MCFIFVVIEDNKKVAAFLRNKMYALLHYLLVLAKPSSKSYNEVITTIGTQVEPKLIVIAEHIKFHQRNQGSDETVTQYMAALWKCVEHCTFWEYLPEVLRDWFVCGLYNRAIQKCLLVEKDLKLDKALARVQEIEAATKQASELHSVTECVGESREIKQVFERASKGTTTKECYLCG